MLSIQCSKCATAVSLADEWAGRSFSCRCGNVIDVPSATLDQEPSPFSFEEDEPIDESGAPAGPRTIWRARGKPHAESYGMISLTFGLTALILNLCSGIWFGLAAGIVAVVVGILSIRHKGRGWGIAGIVVGGIAVVFSSVVIGLLAALFATH